MSDHRIIGGLKIPKAYIDQQSKEFAEYLTAPPVSWRNIHNREATHKDSKGAPCCDPSLGGITMSCIDVEARQ